MSHERSERARQKILARKMRESQAASALLIQDRESWMSETNMESQWNSVKRLLGKYDIFKKVGGNRISMVGVDQQPPTPAPARQPIHYPDNYPPPSGPGSSSSSKRSLPLPQSSHNGTTRTPKNVPSTVKPPSHHAHTKNWEDKGSLKSGPGGGGGGGSRSSSSTSMHKPSLVPLKVHGGGMDRPGDPTIQQIMSEMLSMKHPVSSIIRTPRHNANFKFPITPLKDTPVKDNTSSSKESSSLDRSRRDHMELPQRLGNTSELSRSRQPKPIDGGNVEDDLYLSEDSDEDEERERIATDVRLSSGGHGGTPASQLPSSMGSSSNSSTSEDTSDDSGVSSNNTSDDEDVLDNRTREGKGKRKACDPNTKASCNEDQSKSKMLTSIFDTDDEDSEKVDVKTSHKNKEEPDGASMIRPACIRQSNVSASPESPGASDSSSSRLHRKKKKEKTPPTRDRKRARDTSVESERSTTTRKRKRDSSLESTKSSQRSASESVEKCSKKARLTKESNDVVAATSVHSSLSPGRPTSDQDYTCYLNKAKELKHIADGETDQSMQAMKDLEAALYFILSGKAMENDHDTSAALTMYKDTLKCIKWVSFVFRRNNQEGGINSKLAVISLRCQSLLSLKIYKMLRNEHKENQRQLNRYFQSVARAGSPSHMSQTPSPTGSVGSEGSQSSGYTTSTEGTRQKGGAAPVGHTLPHPQPPHGVIQTVPVPVSIQALIMKQNQLSGHLAFAHDMWIEADHYVYMNKMEDFFMLLENHAGPLTLHSTLYELVYYVMYGLDRVRA